jgi:hypothetical protein
MPIRSVAAMNKSLDNDYGATKGPNAAASHQLALFSSDPLVEDDPTTVELTTGTCPGYGRATIANGAAWAAAANGQKATAAPVTMPAPTAEWAVSATHWGLYGSDGSWWDCGPLTDDLLITGAGPGPLVNPVIFYADSLVGDDTEE